MVMQYRKGKKFNAFDYMPPKDLGKIKVENCGNKSLFYALELTRLYQTINVANKFVSRDQFRYIMKNNRLQNEYAMKLFDSCEFDEQRTYGREHLESIQQFYDKEYPDHFRIVAFSRDVGLKPTWKGEGQRKFNVCIYLENGIWNGIKSTGQFFDLGKEKYCIDCETTYQGEEKHRLECTIRCRKCCRMGFGFPCKPEDNVKILCSKCNREFYNVECFIAHKKKICQLYKKCTLECEKEYCTDRVHICGETRCQTCNVYHDPERGCFIETIAVPERPFVYRIVAFDLESTTDNIVKEGKHMGKREHKANFISARFTCSLCLEEIRDCNICGKKEEPRHLKWCSKDGISPIKEFVSWILNLEKPEGTDRKFRTIAFAHYGCRYDLHLVESEITEQGLEPNTTIAENKIYQIIVRKNRRYPQVIFRDSWLFMLVPLSDLPKTFGLDCSSKLYFPHGYNKEKNYGIKLDKLPSIDDYYADKKLKDEKIKFLEWYKKNENTPFLLEEKLDEYCSNDTEILMKALIKYRECFIKVTTDEETPNGFDILYNSTTIASACSNIYKAKYLKEDHISIVPEGGYERNDRQSEIAIKYFEWLEFIENVEIIHAGKGKEKKIMCKYVDKKDGREKFKKLKLDSYIPEQKKIIEFQGCAYHGCKVCYKPYQIGPNHKTMEENYEETQIRMKMLQKYGNENNIIVEEIWEHEIKKLLKENEEMKNFFEEQPFRGPINPREAYFGGRTAPCCLYAEAGNGMKIGMADIVSLYPYVNYCGKYPIGIPKIISKQRKVNWTKPEDIEYEGILKVRVIPPRDLLYPVLPLHVEGMMLFSLCKKCSKKSETGFKFKGKENECNHTDRERSWILEYTSCELREALKMGYKIDKFYRAYHYEEFDDELFKTYVRKFLKIKVEASGFPADVKTEEDKLKFKKEYMKKYGIEIDLENVKYNPGLRYIAKLCLNSLWGKFSMRNTLSMNEIIIDKKKMHELYNDHTAEITRFIELANDATRVIWKQKESFIKEHSTSNIIISLWTTSLARVKLYEYMKMIFIDPRCKILYTDTDSIIYLFPEGEDPLKTGQYLGDMSKEYNDYEILEYVSGGPKQYSLKLKNKSNGEIEERVKIRGFTLNDENEITFDEFKEMILGYREDDKRKFSYPEKFGPSGDGRVFTRSIDKFYKPVNNKGLIDENWNVFPFGYRDDR